MQSFTVMATAFLTAAACGTTTSSTVVEPSTDDYDDAAQAIASSNGRSGAGDFAAMADITLLAGGVVPSGFSADAQGQYRGNRLGIEYTYTIACDDAAGNPLPGCGELTDKATVELGWAGAFESDHFDAALVREASWTVRGLRSPVATFVGDGSLHVESALRPILRPGVTETFTFDAASSFDAIMIDRTTHEVLGGSASLDLTARRLIKGRGDADLDRTFELHADLTFHGDGTATLVLDGAHTYELDLAVGIAVRR